MDLPPVASFPYDYRPIGRQASRLSLPPGANPYSRRLAYKPRSVKPLRPGEPAGRGAADAHFQTGRPPRRARRDPRNT